LGLDLANRGLAWRTFRSLTGEETPLAQIRGMVEWLGNFTRLQPRTDPYVPIQHAGMNPFGVNTFLEDEVLPENRERQLQMIADAGFAWIRQQFVWQDIEIHGRGDFEDRRNDLDGDGQPDAIDAWAKYDNIVELAEQYDLQILGRLDNPPEWSQTVAGDFAPPDDLQDFVNFAAAVAERYRGRIRYYQVWNEPNIYPEWGEQPVDPEGYTELLCRTYAALKAVDPEIVVISGALAQTIALTQRDLNDFIFLQRMYDAGAGECFDVMATQAYGFYSGPTDRRMRPTTNNFARNLYIRDIMIANGDAHKPIWITETAWNPIDSPEVPPPSEVAQYANFGIVTREQAAAYMPEGYQRAIEEWSWVGVVNYWFFKLPNEDRRNQAMYYFRMVEPDFTPLPVYDSMREYIMNLTPTLYIGVHQAEDNWAITLPETAQITNAEGAQFEQAVETNEVSFIAQGTETVLRWRGESAPVVEANGTVIELIKGATSENGWNTAVIHQSLTPETVAFQITSDSPFVLDSITVYDRTVSNLFPLVGGALAVLGVLAYVVISALVTRFRSG
ncbi:MAG TPA: hypothetical protein VK003_13400, partial [Oceanobacillus sp.]|nr:hypothetical protein [Oceanobacillus sp.]